MELERLRGQLMTNYDWLKEFWRKMQQRLADERA